MELTDRGSNFLAQAISRQMRVEYLDKVRARLTPEEYQRVLAEVREVLDLIGARDLEPPMAEAVLGVAAALYIEGHRHLKEFIGTGSSQN